MIYLALIQNLALLVAISVFSTLLEKRRPSNTHWGALLQGVLFGSAATIGMMQPVMLQPGLFFDGRSVMVSLAALFFGPWTALVAALLALSMRIAIGGTGMLVGVATILSSAAVGLIARKHFNIANHPPRALFLLGFGLVVHTIMLLIMMFLPWPVGLYILSVLALPILILYPIATLLAGKILSNYFDSVKTLAALKESETRFRTLFEEVPAVSLLINPETHHILAANKRACVYYGMAPEKLTALTLSDFDAAPSAQIKSAMHPTKEGYYFKRQIVQGQQRDVELHTSSVVVEGQRCLHTLINDITQRLHDEAVILTHVQRQRATSLLGHKALKESSVEVLMNQTVAVVAEALGVDNCTILHQVSPTSLEVVASVARSASIKPVDAESDPDSEKKSLLPAKYAILTGEPVCSADLRTETRFDGPSLFKSHGVVSAAGVIIRGQSVPYGVLEVQTLSPHEFDQDEIHFLQNIANIVAEAIFRKAAEERILHDNLHDPLTSLPNRTLLARRTTEAFESSPRNTHSTFALLIIDIDRFKNINDTQGHATGDLVLIETARRLRCASRPSDTLARVGGDEFALLMQELDSENTPTVAAENLLAILQTPFIFDNSSVELTATIGIVVATENHESPGQILRDADIALYRAKSIRRGGYQFFDTEMHKRIIERMELEGDLRHALQREEMDLHLQPIISLKTGRIEMFEALLRWTHPRRGMVAPDLFIPIAEETGLIHAIGEWVIRKAADTILQWQGVNPLYLTINISPIEILNPQIPIMEGNTESSEKEGLDQRINRIAVEKGIDPARLGIEITENVRIKDHHGVKDLLVNLVDQGFPLLLDDFGSGYSSLAYFLDLPFTKVKLDRAFTAAVAPGNRTHHLMQGIIMLAHSVGLQVVAEGVETFEQLQLLRDAGCDEAQGYHISPALPIKEAYKFAASDKQW